MNVTAPRPRRLLACGIRRPSGVRITVTVSGGQPVRVLELRPPAPQPAPTSAPEAA